MAHTCKSGSKPERTALRQQLLEGGAGPDQIAAEMRRRWGFRPREAYRHAHGWSQDEVAARFAEIAGRLGTRPAPGERMPAIMVGTRIGEYERWPHGGRRPSPYVLTLLAEVYGTALDRLLDADDLAGMPDQDRAVLAALRTDRPATPARPVPTPVTAGAERAGAEGVRHRAPIVTAEQLAVQGRAAARAILPAYGTDDGGADGGVAWTKAERRAATLDRAAREADPRRLLAVSAAEAAEFGEWAEAVRVGPSTVEQLEQDIRVIAREFLTQPPLPLLRRILHVRNRVFGLLEKRQRPAQARELYLLAGRVCGLAAWTASDLGFPAEASAHARTGWLCGDLADAPGLKGWIRATQSKLAYWEGRPRDSGELAEDGLRQGVRDSGRPLLAALAARAWARCGEASVARRAMRQVGAERAALTGDDEVGGIFGCSEAQQCYLAGTTHMWLNEPDQARDSAERAVWLFEMSDPRDRFYGAEALAQIDSAMAQVTLGDLAGAASRLEPLLQLAPAKRVDLIHKRADDLERLLRRTAKSSRPMAGRLADDLAHFRRAS